MGRTRCAKSSKRPAPRGAIPPAPILTRSNNFLAKLKAHLRKAKEPTLPALYDRIGHALEALQASEFPNYFIKSGYASP